MSEPSTDDRDASIPTADFSDFDDSEFPAVAIGPADLDMSILAVRFTLHDLQIDGAISEEGIFEDDFSASCSVDLIEVGASVEGALGLVLDAFGLDLSTEASACDSMAVLGLDCSPCTHRSGSACLAIVLDDVPATIVDTEL
jgi:hypothetical protein